MGATLINQVVTSVYLHRAFIQNRSTETHRVVNFRFKNTEEKVLLLWWTSTITLSFEIFCWQNETQTWVKTRKQFMCFDIISLCVTAVHICRLGSNFMPFWLQNKHKLMAGTLMCQLKLFNFTHTQKNFVSSHFLTLAHQSKCCTHSSPDCRQKHLKFICQLIGEYRRKRRMLSFSKSLW